MIAQWKRHQLINVSSKILQRLDIINYKELTSKLASIFMLKYKSLNAQLFTFSVSFFVISLWMFSV